MQLKRIVFAVLFFIISSLSSVNAEMIYELHSNEQPYRQFIGVQNWRENCNTYSLRQLTAKNEKWASFVGRMCPYMYSFENGEGSINSRGDALGALAKMGAEAMFIATENLVNPFLNAQAARIINRENVGWLASQSSFSLGQGTKVSLTVRGSQKGFGVGIKIKY